MEKKSIARAIQKSLNGGTRRRRVRWLYGFIALISVTMFILFWYTNVFHDAILSNLELRNGTLSFLFWQKPPVNLEIKIYVFNYTNVREFESGNATKLKVEEVGPFIYRENLSRMNVEIHENGTITYQEKKTYEWISGKSENEKVIVPNVMLMSTLAFSRNFSYLFQIGLTMFLSRIRAEPFLELSVGQYLWGYEDELYEMAKQFSSLRSVFILDKFGLLAFVRISMIIFFSYAYFVGFVLFVLSVIYNNILVYNIKFIIWKSSKLESLYNSRINYIYN